VRRKVEAWLGEPDSQMAIALRTRPAWTGDALLTFGTVTARIVPCVTPLAVRAALQDRGADERLVVLTDLSDIDLGDGILAHLSRNTVRSVDAWELVRQMFGVQSIDPTLTSSKFGGGKWIADALTDFAPAEGWPRPPGTVLTRDHALRSLVGRLFGVDGFELDSAGLLQWTTEPHAQLRFLEFSAEVIDGVTKFLVDVAGPAVAPIMLAVRAGHGVDAIPLGLLVAALWSEADSTAAAVARTRLEPTFGGARLTEPQARAFQAAAEAWVDRTLDSGRVREVRRILARAEAIAIEIDAMPLLGASDLLPSGFTQRLRAFAGAVRLAVPSGDLAPTDLAVAAQRALAAVEQHRAADPARVGTAQMAVRLLRWLAIPDRPGPATLLDALNRQVRDDGWVDRARLDVFAGDVDAQVAEAYLRLHGTVDARRRRHDRQFAELLAANAAANAEPGALLRVEDVLESVVRPILQHGRRVLLLILDGMGMAAATELAESVTRSGAWFELTPSGGPRIGILAALPTVTEVSRCSLLAGRIMTGGQAQEREAFTQRFPGAMLLHKSALRAGAGHALDRDVTDAIGDAFVPLVAAVVNTIDDALDRSDPGITVWGEDNVVAVRDLLALAEDRVVVVVSDHGHVVDRGPDAMTRPSPTHENRWRPAVPPPAEGEVEVAGSRVALGGGQVVLPWREEFRYGPRKAGYHGGAAPAEAVIPLIVLAGDEAAVPGWAGAPVASPNWWREALPDGAPTAPRASSPSVTAKRPVRPQEPALFDLPSPLPAAPREASPAGPVRLTLIDALLASETYRQRRDPRAPLPDERVAALLSALIAGGGRATMETLAAHASVPAHRVLGVVTALRKLLQVEGYPVLSVDPDGQTVKLDSALLAEQFHLDVS
jgi:hypothetical protein